MTTASTANSPQADTCSYQREDGSHCPGPKEGGGQLCYWHDGDASKEAPEATQRLEEWAATGESMEGFVLRYAQLQGVKLYQGKQPILKNANLFRAELPGASMYRADLRGAELLKSNLAGANLNEARLEDAELLGANFDGTRLERVQWGEQCINERQAREALDGGDRDQAIVKFEEAEEIYRTLRRAHDGAGHFEQAGVFFRCEMTMRRMLLKPWSMARLWSRLVDMFCAYGESPPRVIVSSALFNFACALVYWGFGVNGPDGPIGFDTAASIKDNAYALYNCVYYSIVTFTTLGYGEITPPPGGMRILAALQAFSGAFMMAMFVAVFGKKMTRG
ncbi:MAG: pentapeptide repeat-containing protein [Candidatus Latescibacterota bacterium]|nr:pentapeptide repeat-containing protein [Candidatus Latescibacterota bacterium]